MNRIRTRHIRKDFFSLRRGTVTALREIDLDIEPGSFFVLLGPSGCGKSTLLNIIAGLERPTDGELWIGDRLVASRRPNTFLSPRQRDVAMVFQSYALYPHMTVFDNIAFPLKIARLDKQEIHRKVEQTATVLEIHELMDAKPAELSGGQRQRVALGRAIVREPAVLLLDEPLSNLDALLRDTMRSELKQVQRRLGVTTIYVTHDQTEAMTLGDRVAVLADGEVQQIGSPAEIYDDPENLFVARFVGMPPINLLSGSLLKHASREFSQSAPKTLDETIIGLRPEHLRARPGEEGPLQGELILISNLGNETLLYIKVDGDHVVARSTWDLDSFREGERVSIDFDRERLLFFEKHTSRRIR